MMIKLILFNLYFCVCLGVQFLPHNLLKIRSKTTYCHKYNDKNEMGLEEIVEYDKEGNIIFNQRFHPYQDNKLLESTSYYYLDNDSVEEIHCYVDFKNGIENWQCDTIKYHDDKIRTFESNNFVNKNDTSFYHQCSNKKEVKSKISYKKDGVRLIRSETCRLPDGGCIHPILGKDYDSTIQIFDNNKLSMENVYIRDEKNSVIYLKYTYDNHEMLKQIDICEDSVQNCQWKKKYVYEYWK